MRPVLPDIDFTQIRVHANSRNKGFEELAVLLFRSRFARNIQFHRVDDRGGDGGVEDIAELENGRKIGMQAKYVSKIDQSFWSQLNKSVRTALTNHATKLTEYHVFAPCNRPKTTKSWGNYQQKWRAFSKTLGYKHSIKFHWHGESEIRSYLIEEKHQSLLYYWFGARYFSADWLQEKYQACRTLIDTRYTPERHVRTDSERCLDAFFLTDSFVTAISKTFYELLSTCRSELTFVETEALEHASLALKTCDQIAELFTNDRALPSAENLTEKLKLLDDSISQLGVVFRNLQGIAEKKKATTTPRSGYESRPYSSQLDDISKASNAVADASRFIETYIAYNSSVLLVIGEAGSGKSHLLTKSVEAGLARGQTGLLFAGEQFSDARPVHLQICEILGWSDNHESLFSAVEVAAKLAGKPAVIAIDAANECLNRSLWNTQLISFFTLLQQYPNIRLVISCRTDFANITLPKHPLENWPRITHEGFGTDIFDAVSNYFSGYGIRCSHFPPLLPEFKNPLFLKLLCEAFKDQTIPEGSLSFVQVMEKRIEHCCSSIQKAIDCSPAKTRKALSEIASQLSQNSGFPIPLDDVMSTTERIFPEHHESRSLFKHLRSNGILTETIRYVGEADERQAVHSVRFPFERFSDYLICSEILKPFKTLGELKKAWKKKGLPGNWTKDWASFAASRGLLKMFSILIPERFGCEFLDLYNESGRQGVSRDLLRDFLDSLAWRTTRSINEKSETLLSTCRQYLSNDEYLNGRLRVVTIPNHPFNSTRIHDTLKSLSLPDRELAWTIPITHLTGWDEPNTVDEIIRWAFHVPDRLISDEQAWLVALVLTWLLSSNFRLLRRRASLALIKILRGRSDLTERLTREFHDCNDAYVVERVYAVACGVALRETNQNALKAIATTVYEKMFSTGNVPAHVLQREYAQLVVERAFALGVFDKNFDIAKCRPPFRSRWPSIPSEPQIRRLEKEEGWYAISSSLKPEGMGMYGDFGRYVMDSHVHKFSKQKLKNKYRKMDRYADCFPGMDARRYIFGRIRRNGWTVKRYAEYEKRLNGGRMRSDQEENKIERISKKYQWIGLHEILAYLSDHNWMALDFQQDSPDSYQGAWQIWIRDFDPSHPLIDPKEGLKLGNEDLRDLQKEKKSFIHFPFPFANSKLNNNRAEWIDTRPADFTPLISIAMPGERKSDWLVLSGHYTWNEPISATQDRAKDGQLRMWADVRCWLIPTAHRDQFLKDVAQCRFYGSGCDLPSFHDCWIGEYPWSPSTKDNDEWFHGDRWVEKSVTTPLVQTFCSFKDERPNHYPRLPSPILFRILDLRWEGEGYDFCNAAGERLATCLFDEDKFVEFGGILVVKKDSFLEAARKSGYTPMWAVLSERSCYSSESDKSIVKKWGLTQTIYEPSGGTLQNCHRLEYDIPLFR